MQNDGYDQSELHWASRASALRLGDQRHFVEAALLDTAHDAHDRAVVDPLVTANENRLVVPTFGDRLEPAGDFVER